MNNDIIKTKQDLTYLNWSKIKNSSGTAGSFLKSYSEISGKKIYYKLSNYDTLCGVTGHECVNELIADRLLTALGVSHLPYRLINASILVGGKQIDTFLCASEDFRKPGEDKIALDVYYEKEHHPEESSLDFCVRMGWSEYIWKMLAVDYIILNRDRHGANMEILRDRKKKTIRPAPLFDHGLSLLFTCGSDDAAEKFDVAADRKIQSFVGSSSAWDNLGLIPKDRLPDFSAFKESERETIMEGLDGIISNTMQNKIWEMIWRRYCLYEDFCDKRRNG